MNLISLDDLMIKKSSAVDPKRFRQEIFELLSIPAFDKGQPEIVPGSLSRPE